MFRGSRDPMLLSLRDGTLVEANDQALRLYGAEREWLLGRRPGEIAVYDVEQVRSRIAGLQVGESFSATRNRDPSRWRPVPGGGRDHPVAGGGGTATARPHPRPHGPATPGSRDGRGAEDGGGQPPGAGSRPRARQSASGDPRLQPAHPPRSVPAGGPAPQRGAAGGGSRTDPGTSPATCWIS